MVDSVPFGVGSAKPGHIVSVSQIVLEHVEQPIGDLVFVDDAVDVLIFDGRRVVASRVHGIGQRVSTVATRPCDPALKVHHIVVVFKAVDALMKPGQHGHAV